MSAELKKENVMFILPEDLPRLKKNRQTPDIEEAMRNIEWLQRIEKVDNTLDFVEIEADSMVTALDEQNLDVALNLLPTFLTDVRKLVKRLRSK